jgi:hypothetical protein
MRVTSFTHCSDFGTGIWPAVEVEQGGGRRKGAGWGSAARLGFGTGFVRWVGELGLGGEFGPLDGDHVDGSGVLRCGDPWVVSICPLIG